MDRPRRARVVRNFLNPAVQSFPCANRAAIRSIPCIQRLIAEDFRDLANPNSIWLKTLNQVPYWRNMVAQRMRQTFPAVNDVFNLLSDYCNQTLARQRQLINQWFANANPGIVHGHSHRHYGQQLGYRTRALNQCALFVFTIILEKFQNLNRFLGQQQFRHLPFTPVLHDVSVNYVRTGQADV